MKQLIKYLMPNYFLETIRVYRRFTQNKRMDLYLKENCAQELSSEQIHNLKMLPTRRELLEVLPKESVVAEVGVAEGLFSFEILTVCKPKKLHLIDKWSSSDPRYCKGELKVIMEKFTNEINKGVIEINRGCSWDVLRSFENNYFDWVYIDAAHDFQSVKKDLEACKPKLKKSGVISGHDYTLWSNHGLSRFGVVEAVNEFCNKYAWEMIYLTNQSNRHLSFAIKKLECKGTLFLEHDDK